VIASIVVVAACSGGGAAATPSPTAAAAPPSATAAPSGSASAAPSTAPASASAAPASASPSIPTGPASLSGPTTIEGGKTFEVAWTGPNAPKDYVTIVPAGADKWTDEPYFYTTNGSPGKLVAPTTAGPHVLWYVSGTDDSILARVAITVTPFEGALAGPDSVVAGTSFNVGWNGPDGPQDYVTIIAKGAKAWTNESYFYTHDANPGKLVAPITPGDFELWYVTGTDSKTMAHKPITVTPFTITLDAPDSVDKGSTFQVAWTGPNGPSDYITIVPAGSKPGTYTNYAYTKDGSPVTLTAPDTAGKYEIWYASDRVPGTFAKTPIEVN
jgi:Ca-activated chloride channel family protein